MGHLLALPRAVKATVPSDFCWGKLTCYHAFAFILSNSGATVELTPTHRDDKVGREKLRDPIFNRASLKPGGGRIKCS